MPKPAIDDSVVSASDTVFASTTQAYREVLLGCVLARLQDRTIDIRLPYKNLGPRSFNGRELDQRAVNPFLHDHSIPGTRNPYLSKFRRSVQFDETAKRGSRDKKTARAGGDITVTSGDRALLTIEVTERPVDRTRVLATFNAKIAPQGIEDYLFFVKRTIPDEKAMVQARQYFVQGHEVNFLEIGPWIRMVLATIGTRGRDLFNRKLIELLDDPEVPRAMKVAWNDRIAALVE